MGTSPDRIEGEIAREREQLARDLADLERKVRGGAITAIDEHPWKAVGIAFGTGVLLAFATGRNGRCRGKRG